MGELLDRKTEKRKYLFHRLMHKLYIWHYVDREYSMDINIWQSDKQFTIQSGQGMRGDSIN